ncbi:5406_t:CDS:2, partial [Gigaspora margarita]
PKLHIKPKKPKYEEVEETSVSDKTSEHSNTEPTYWSSEEHLNKETESILTISYTLLNEKPRKMLNHEDIDNYHLSQTSLVDIIEVLVEYDEFDMDSLYEITDNELLPEASVDSDESNIEVSINSVLKNTSSDFKGFDITSEYEDLVKIITHSKFRKNVSKNIWQVQRWRNRRLLVETRQHDAPLCIKKTSSTYKSTKKTFTISPLIYLERVLNNPALMPEIIQNKK